MIKWTTQTDIPINNEHFKFKSMPRGTNETNINQRSKEEVKENVSINFQFK